MKGCHRLLLLTQCYYQPKRHFKTQVNVIVFSWGGRKGKLLTYVHNTYDTEVCMKLLCIPLNFMHLVTNEVVILKGGKGHEKFLPAGGTTMCDYPKLCSDSPVMMLKLNTPSIFALPYLSISSCLMSLFAHTKWWVCLKLGTDFSSLYLPTLT